MSALNTCSSSQSKVSLLPFVVVLYLLILIESNLAALCERLLDFDENVRKQVVAVICDVACHALNAVPLETVKLVAERLRDKSVCIPLNFCFCFYILINRLIILIQYLNSSFCFAFAATC